MEYIEVTGKSVEEAITNACTKLGIPSDKLDYEVIDKGNSGFLGIFNSKPAKIKAREKQEESVVEQVKAEEKPKAEPFTAEQKEVIKKDIQTFLNNMFGAMNMEVKADITFDDEENSVNVDLSGDNMGVLIGKRGQTLDSIQYLTSLVINKNSEKYVRVKLDTENYRKRRKETLESLAKNIAYKVKRSRRPVSLEPMNPYERRIIHSALQADKFVSTRSEGEEPFRHVVVYLERENNNRYNR